MVPHIQLQVCDIASEALHIIRNNECSRNRIVSMLFGRSVYMDCIRGDSQDSRHPALNISSINSPTKFDGSAYLRLVEIRLWYLHLSAQPSNSVLVINTQDTRENL